MNVAEQILMAHSYNKCGNDGWKNMKGKGNGRTISKRAIVMRNEEILKMKNRETTRKVKEASTVVERNPTKKRFSATISNFVDECKNNNVPKIKYDEAQFIHDDQMLWCRWKLPN